MRTTLTLSLLILLHASSARAQAPAAAVPEGSHPRRSVSVTVSPVHLLFPILELTGEYRAHDKIGIAGIAGIGRLSEKDKLTDRTLSATVLELGLSGRYYVIGDFRHGMQLGLEALYINLSGSVGSASAVADGIAVGPFAGYKYTADIGFTFDAQLGVQRAGFAASAKEGTGSASASAQEWIVLLNLNVGWSF